MLRFSATTPTGRQIVGLGLEEGNLERLRAGKPIAVKLDELAPGLAADLVIFYGKDRHAMVDMMAGSIGPDTKINPDITAARDIFHGRKDTA